MYIPVQFHLASFQLLRFRISARTRIVLVMKFSGIGTNGVSHTLSRLTYQSRVHGNIRRLLVQTVVDMILPVFAASWTLLIAFSAAERRHVPIFWKSERVLTPRDYLAAATRTRARYGLTGGAGGAFLGEIKDRSAQQDLNLTDQVRQPVFFAKV